MKKQVSILSAILFAVFVSAQKSYVQGYFVQNNGEKTECLIDNKDWESSPRELYYKRNETSKPERILIDSIRLFEIPGYSKYVCTVVQIDKSSEDISNLSPQKNPVWQTERLALQVLTEGKAVLYMYSNKEIIRFFYAVNDSIIRQLVYKSYRAANANGTSYVGTNASFRQQLFVDVNNPNYKYDLSKLLYEKNELTQYFEKYNAQFEPANTAPKKEKVKRDFFKASVLTGVNYSSMVVKDMFHPINSQDFGSFISPTIGVEIEFVLPFSVQNWSVLLQPTYNSKISGEVNGIRYTDDAPIISNFSYVGIDIPLGIRYRYGLNNNFKICATGYFYSGASSWYDMSIHVDRYDFVIQLARAIAPGVGIGVDYNNFGLELKAIVNRDFLLRQQTFDTNFNVVSLNLKYKFVDLKINR